MSLRNDILHQVYRKKAGIVFSFRDLVFPLDKLANVAVVLSELCKAGVLRRLERGAYFKPIQPNGLEQPDLTQDALVKYLTSKYRGYLTGACVYNQLGLTNTPWAGVTIATHKNARSMSVCGLKVDFVKAYIGDVGTTDDLLCAQLLDAIKNIKSIPGRTEQEVYDVLKINHIKEMSSGCKKRLVDMAHYYPPRVKKILGDIFEDIQEYSMRDKVIKGLYPTTKYLLNYSQSPLSTSNIMNNNIS